MSEVTRIRIRRPRPLFYNRDRTHYAPKDILYLGLITPAHCCSSRSRLRRPLVEGGLDPARLALISPRLKTFVDQGEIAGAVTLVARHGEIAHFDAIGWQDMENKKPMRSDSIFQIMSMTKPLTGLGIMMLMEEGRLTLNDPVEIYICREFRDQHLADGSKPKHPITIRDLMTHTSGMSGRLPDTMPTSTPRWTSR